METYKKGLLLGKIVLEDIEETLKGGDKEDIVLGYEKLREVIRKLEMSKDKTTEEIHDAEKTIEVVREWNKQQREEMGVFRVMRKKLKEQLDK